MAKVTVRTLHYYDEIGLLTPSGRSSSRYRLYTQADIRRLQQIRFHRELGMALEEIRHILDSPDFDTRAALQRHRQLLGRRLQKTAALVATIERMLEDMEGVKTMPNEDLFEGFKQEDHANEAEARWGNTATWKESQRRVTTYNDDDWCKIKAEAQSIVDEMAKLQVSGNTSDSEAVMAAAERHRLHIDRWFYACSRQMHRGLAEMYVSDARFATFFDKHHEGLSGYVAEAIRANAER